MTLFPRRLLKMIRLFERFQNILWTILIKVDLFLIRNNCNFQQCRVRIWIIKVCNFVLHDWNAKKKRLFETIPTFIGIFLLKPKAIIAGITEIQQPEISFIHFSIDNSNLNISLYTLSQGLTDSAIPFHGDFCYFFYF